MRENRNYGSAVRVRFLATMFVAEQGFDSPMLRISYLDKAGVPSHGQWGEETEKNFREGNFDC